MTLSTRTHMLESVDLSTADDELLREVGALNNVIASERVPEDPPVSFEAFASRVRNRPKMIVIRDWLARSADGELVAPLAATPRPPRGDRTPSKEPGPGRI
jgi:hypothetical protein